MGYAAYARGSAAISKQIDMEKKARRLIQIDKEDLQTMENNLAALREKSAKLEHDLRLALDAKRILSITLTMERQRIRRCIGAIEEIREEFRGERPSRAYYIAILAMLRVRRALRGDA